MLLDLRQNIVDLSERILRKSGLNDKNLSKYFLNLPVMIFKVILLIHYHALRLWIKNVPYFKKPEKPDANIS